MTSVICLWELEPPIEISDSCKMLRAKHSLSYTLTKLKLSELRGTFGLSIVKLVNEVTCDIN